MKKKDTSIVVHGVVYYGIVIILCIINWRLPPFWILEMIIMIYESEVNLEVHQIPSKHLKSFFFSFQIMCVLRRQGVSEQFSFVLAPIPSVYGNAAQMERFSTF